jgi:hypothetical protein
MIGMNDDAEIVQILRAVGVYDWIREKVKSESELIEMFKGDFDKLI